MALVTINNFNDLLTIAQGMYNKEKQKADETVPKVMKITPIGSNYAFSAYSLKVGKSFYSNGRDPETIAECTTAVAEFIKGMDKAEAEVHEKIAANVSAIENNKAIQVKVKQIMTDLGIPLTYQERDWKSKARTPKYTTNTAGYISDLNRNVIINDYGQVALTSIAKARADANAWLEKKKKELAAKEAEAAKLLEATRAYNVLVHMRVKYDCDPEATLRELLMTIINKNKYLRLSYYMERNRNDWSEGPDYAETGLNGFVIETEQDNEIYDAVNEACTDWGGDGRVFRDMKWNYGVIYGLVEDASLMKDYTTIAELYEKEQY